MFHLEWHRGYVLEAVENEMSSKHSPWLCHEQYFPSHNNENAVGFESIYRKCAEDLIKLTLWNVNVISLNITITSAADRCWEEGGGEERKEEVSMRTWGTLPFH